MTRSRKCDRRQIDVTIEHVLAWSIPHTVVRTTRRPFCLYLRKYGARFPRPPLPASANHLSFGALRSSKRSGGLRAHLMALTSCNVRRAATKAPSVGKGTSPAHNTKDKARFVGNKAPEQQHVGQHQRQPYGASSQLGVPASWRANHQPFVAESERGNINDKA